jgi:hypothetical protein
VTPAPTAAGAAHPLVSLGQVQAALGALGAGLALIVTLGLTYVFLPRAVASVRITFAERRARVAEAALSDLSAGIEALTTQVAGLRSDVAQLRKTQVVSTRYIAQLVLFIRSRKPVDAMPPLPDEISDDVLAEIRAHELVEPSAP